MSIYLVTVSGISRARFQRFTGLFQSFSWGLSQGFFFLLFCGKLGKNNSWMEAEI